MQRALFSLLNTGLPCQRARESGFFPFSLRFRTAEELLDRAKNFLNILEHLVVPESKHSVASRIKKRGAHLIFSRAVRMLGAIEFDNEASFDRAEVSEERPNRMLTAKLGAPHPAASQMSPENSFRVGLFVPQASSVSLR
jgi:hypothetical protein